LAAPTKLAYLRWLSTMSERLRNAKYPNCRSAGNFGKTVGYWLKAGLTTLVMGPGRKHAFAVSSAGARLRRSAPFWTRVIGDGDPSKLFHMQTTCAFGCVIRHYLDRSAAIFSGTGPLTAAGAGRPTPESGYLPRSAVIARRPRHRQHSSGQRVTLKPQHPQRLTKRRKCHRPAATINYQCVVAVNEHLELEGPAHAVSSPGHAAQHHHQKTGQVSVVSACGKWSSPRVCSTFSLMGDAVDQPGFSSRRTISFSSKVTHCVAHDRASITSLKDHAKRYAVISFTMTVKSSCTKFDCSSTSTASAGRERPAPLRKFRVVARRAEIADSLSYHC
jgi:hypothetical protein